LHLRRALKNAASLPMAGESTLQLSGPVIDLSTISTLVVEANPGMRTQLRDMLALSGISKVQFAVTAGVAVRKLREGRFDLILCEYHLGEGQDGQHLLEDLRHNAVIPLETLFIMVTGERQYERVISTAELTPNDYILKPFAADTLLARIQRSLAKRDAFLPTYRLIAIGDNPGAIQTTIEGEERFPNHATDFLRLRAELLITAGQVAEAQAVYQRILETRAVPWARLGLAKTLHLQKRYKEAEALLTQLVGENEMFLNAYDWLARTRQAVGDLAPARDALATAAARSPHRVNRLRRLGEMCLDLGDHEAAERTLAEVVRQNKYSDFRDPEDHVRLVQAQVATGHLTEAEGTIRDLERSMAGAKKTSLCAALSSALYHGEAGQPEKAQATLKQALDAEPAGQGLSPGLRRELVKACFKNELEDHATEVVLDLFRNAADQESVEATRQLLESHGRGHLSAGLEKRIHIEVKNLVAAGAEKAQAGDYDGAVTEMMNAVRKMPGNTHVLFNAALALLRHIEHRGWNERFATQARHLIDRVRRQDPANVRLPALTEFMHGLLSKYGIRPD
jgi:predicted Zn-dependent protease